MHEPVGFNRWLLNTFSIWELALILIAACMVVSLGGLFVARRFVPSLVGKAGERSLSTAVGIATGLFSFVLAFTIGQLYSGFTNAGNAVQNEATQLSQLVRVSSYLSAKEGRDLNRLALTYAREVEGHEWSLMRSGHASPQAWRLIDRMYGDLAAYKPATPNEGAFYGQATSLLNQLVAARRTRLAAAESPFPHAFEVMLAIGAVLALLTTLNFKPADDRLQLFTIAAASALVGMALLVALSLEYPFSGDVTVSKTPFSQITQAQLDYARR
ncbi:MAG: DUF4239 domain-containing protein [Actinobacteria bacterium]|nr:DUF4239 domain-containing protein [Actinomycetota bacterium]